MGCEYEIRGPSSKVAVRNDEGVFDCQAIVDSLRNSVAGTCAEGGPS